MTRRGMAFALLVAILSAVAAAQAYAPIVTMVVTMPDGRTQEVTAAESGLATLTLRDGTEYGFRPTCTMESNCRDHLQERDDQRADGRSRRSRSPERRSGNGCEDESFLQSVCSQGVGSNLAK